MPTKLVPVNFRRGAGIQAFLLDARQKHAGMTSWGMDTLFRGAVLRQHILMVCAFADGPDNFVSEADPVWPWNNFVP